MDSTKGACRPRPVRTATACLAWIKEVAGSPGSTFTYTVPVAAP